MLGAEFFLGQVVVDERGHLVVVDGLVADYLAVFDDEDAVHVDAVADVIEITEILITVDSLVERRHMVGHQDDQAVGIELGQAANIRGNGLGAVPILVGGPQ